MPDMLNRIFQHACASTINNQVGNINLLNRVAMTAMTRTRNDPVTELPREINVQYYSQRASPGTLLVSEGTAPTANGRGYVRAPNLYEPASAGAWKAVTDAVHGKGAFIYAQLMHAGRVSHSSLLDGATPLAPSAIKMGGQVHTKTGKVCKLEECDPMVHPTCLIVPLLQHTHRQTTRCQLP